jgi:hypothetical protein
LEPFVPSVLFVLLVLFMHSVLSVPFVPLVLFVLLELFVLFVPSVPSVLLVPFFSFGACHAFGAFCLSITFDQLQASLKSTTSTIS